MQMVIEIINATESTVPTAKGSYKCLEVAYKRDGKIEGKKLMDFASPIAFKALSNAKSGDIFTIQSEKEASRDGKEYWQWKGASQGGTPLAPEAAVSAAKPSAVGKSTYETPEERAKKQVYIVRQSSLTTALKLFEINGIKKVSLEELTSQSQKITDWVFDKPSESVAAMKAIEDMPNDVPY